MVPGIRGTCVRTHTHNITCVASAILRGTVDLKNPGCPSTDVRDQATHPTDDLMCEQVWLAGTAMAQQLR
jgi:hypothetical protein